MNLCIHFKHHHVSFVLIAMACTSISQSSTAAAYVCTVHHYYHFVIYIIVTLYIRIVGKVKVIILL